MKRFTIAMMALVFAVGMPMIAIADMDHDMKMDKDKAMDHGMKMDKDKAMDHGMKMDKDKAMDHGMKMDKDKAMDHDMKGHDMAKDGDFVEIGKDTQKGVVATAKVKTYDEKARATMAKMGMSATHHIMVFFVDEKSGDAVASGKVAVKVKGSDAKPVMLMQMETGFGGDVSLEEGMATFEIGTKLGDGQKRQFSIKFHNM